MQSATRTISNPSSQLGRDFTSEPQSKTWMSIFPFKTDEFLATFLMMSGIISCKSVRTTFALIIKHYTEKTKLKFNYYII